MEFWIGGIVFWIVCGIGAAVIADSKGRRALLWFLCGGLVGFIGLPITIGVTPVERQATEPEPRRCPPVSNKAWRQPRVREADNSPAWIFISLLRVLVGLVIIIFIWLGPF